MNRWLEYFKSNDYLNVKKYIRDGGNMDETNDIGESILACAIRARCDFDLLMLLVENGADAFDFDEEGVSIFDIAITYDNIEMVEYLIKEGIDVNKTSRRSGFTPLMAATCYGRNEIVELLLKNGVEQTARDSKGFTAIDFARKMNKKSILKILDYDENDPKNTAYAR